MRQLRQRPWPLPGPRRYPMPGLRRVRARAGGACLSPVLDSERGGRYELRYRYTCCNGEHLARGESVPELQDELSRLRCHVHGGPARPLFVGGSGSVGGIVHA